MSIGKSYIVSASFVMQGLERLDLKRLLSVIALFVFAGISLVFVPNSAEHVSLETEAQQPLEQRLLNSLPQNLQKRAQKYIKPVIKIAAIHGVDPVWVLSVMWTESHFRDQAQSHVGAYGLMQLMPATREYLKRKHRIRGNKLITQKDDFSLFHYFPAHLFAKKSKWLIHDLENIELGVIYLKFLMKKFKNTKYAIVAYNMGPGWTQRRLRSNLPVGVKNKYLAKVEKAYTHLSSRI